MTSGELAAAAEVFATLVNAVAPFVALAIVVIVPTNGFV